jgi:hypothetical protein
MANLQIERLRALPVHRDDEVWEVGFLFVPMLVSDGVGTMEPTQPIIAACTSTLGGLAATDPCLPQDMPRTGLLDALAKFALDPHVPGVPALEYLPKVVRTSPDGGDVAAEFETAMRDLGVEVEVKAELPNLEDVARFLNEQASGFIEEEDDAPPPRMPAMMGKKGMTVERVRAFADAASIFFEAEPWTRFSAEVLWRVEPKPKTRALSHFTILGGGGEEFGLGFLTSPLDLMRMMFRNDPEAMARSQWSTMWSVTFEEIDGLPEKDAALWRRESLPVAAEDAYPIPLGVTPSGNFRRPTLEQMNDLEGVLRAAAQLTPDHIREDSVAFTVHTHDGERTLRLHVALDLGRDVNDAVDS